MIAIVHSIYSQSVHAPALHAALMDNDAERYCIVSNEVSSSTKSPLQKIPLSHFKIFVHKYFTENVIKLELSFVYGKIPMV